jgi:hypothetical protein
MVLKKFMKAFAAGMVFPAVFLPCVLTLLNMMGSHQMRMHPAHMMDLVPMYLPILWGVANAIFAHVHEGNSARSINHGLWITGACLGFVVAVCGVFILHIPTMVFGDLNGIEYAPLVVLPVIYGALFRYIVKWCNKSIGV